MTQADIARNYLSILKDHLNDRAEADPALAPFAQELAKVDTTHIQRGPLPRLDHPTMALLETAISAADGDPALVEAAVDAARHLDWGQIYDNSGIDPVLAEGMLAAQAAGTYGCFVGGTIATGQFLLAPGVHYPLHTHAATEIYYCISGTIEIQHGIDEAPFALTPGNYSITPSGRVHALTTGTEPVLMLYAWIGDIGVPIWMWEKDSNGIWIRESWRRLPGEPWKVEQSEPVSAEAMAEAHN